MQPTFVLPTHNFTNFPVVKMVVFHTRLAYCRMLRIFSLQFYSLCFYDICFSVYDHFTYFLLRDLSDDKML